MKPHACVRPWILASTALLCACTSDDGGDALAVLDSSVTRADGAVNEAGPSASVDAALVDGAPPAGDATSPAQDGAVSTTCGSAACRVAAKLGRDHFLIGLGNDLANDHDRDGAYTLGVTLDVHYAYLTGLSGRGGWPDWNPDGSFVNLLTDSAKRHGSVPMFTTYAMAVSGENNARVLTDDSYMRPYWADMKLLFERLGVYGDPAVVHFEPDFWAYMQQHSRGDPASVPAHVSSLAADCADRPNNLVGLGQCLVVLARKYAPKTLVGFHASSWADADPTKVGAFLAQIGGSDADFVFMDMLDRDAGCFEAHTDPHCQRGGTTGWYWDESNTRSPNFRENIDFAAAVTRAAGKPLMWWQLPLGVPSDTPGGSAGHYRDNRVRYVFAHIDEFIASGAVGAVFGTGAGNQTDITTDGDQFRRAVNGYFGNPVKLP